MKPRIIPAIIVGLLVAAGVSAGVVGPMYMDSATGQAFPAQVPPTHVVFPRATKTLTVSATNTVTTTDIATATPSASSIPMSGTDNKIDNGWLKTSVLTATATDVMLGSGFSNRYAFFSGTNRLTYSLLRENSTSGLYREAPVNQGDIYLHSFGDAYPETSTIMHLKKSRGTTAGSWVATANGDNIGALRFYGTGSGGSESSLWAGMEARQVGAALASGVPMKLVLRTINGSGSVNTDQLVLQVDGSVTSSGPLAATNQVSCPAPLQCNGAATASLIGTSTLTLSIATGTNSSTVARGDDGASAHTLSVQGNGWIKTDTTTNTYGSASLAKDMTVVISQTSTSTATATATVTNTISVSPGLNLTTGTDTTTATTANISANPKLNLSAILYCSGCQLSGTGTVTATSMAISQSPEIIVTPTTVGSPPTSRTVCGHPLSADVTCTPTDVGAAPASAISGTQNYLAKFGATGATVGSSIAREESGRIIIPGSTTTPTLAVGALESFSYSTNNAALLNNLHYNGSGWFLRETGYGAGVYFINGEAYITTSSYGAAGSNAGLLDRLHVYNDGRTLVTYGDFEVGLSAVSATGKIKLNGGTSGSATITVPAVAGTTTWKLPATNGVTGQGLYTTDGAGTLGWFTPMVADGTTGTGCTTISSTSGKVTACDTTAKVTANAAITASGATYKIVQYDSKGLVTAGANATPANIGALAADGASGTGCSSINSSAGKVTSCDTTARVAANGAITGATNTKITYDSKGLVTSGAQANFSDLAGTVSDAQHGNRGNGSLHTVATTSVNGFMSSTDKTKLDGIASSATNTPLSNSTPTSPNYYVHGAGSATSAARADHRHAGEISLSWAPVPPSVDGIFGEYVDAGSWKHMTSFPVYWIRMPSNLAIWSAVTYYNDTGSAITCYLEIDQADGFLASGTSILTGNTSSIGSVQSATVATASTFTKSSGNSGTFAFMQVWAYCTPNAGRLVGIHILITGTDS